MALVSAISDLLGALLLFAGAPAYYVLLVGRRGSSTLGHRALGLAVLDERTQAPVDLQRAALRFAVGVALLIPFALPALASAVGLANKPARRAWHDFASDCIVTCRRR